MSDQTIHVFVRHCQLSTISANKARPSWFSRQACLENLLQTSDANTKITVMFDGKKDGHFVTKYPVDVVEIEGGSETRSFRNMIQYVLAQPLHDNSIIYFVEDDYMHVPGWCNVMREAFSNMISEYVTLYDHKDKYFLPMYKNLQSKILVTDSCHWRTVPSTTNTYAMRLGTLKKHLDIHLQYSDVRAQVSRDHEKFLHLNAVGSSLVSPIPGYSTHCETAYLSPVVQWDTLARVQTTPAIDAAK